jgi:hypothetical protein
VRRLRCRCGWAFTCGSGSHVLLGVGLTTINKTFDIYGAAEGIFQAGTGTSAVIASAKEFSRITIKDSPTTVLEIGDASVAEINLGSEERDEYFFQQLFRYSGPLSPIRIQALP